MCFNNDMPEPAKPAPPPETLEQEAPDKKTSNQRSANQLSIGTKAYRNESGLGITGRKQKTTPSGPSVAV